MCYLEPTRVIIMRQHFFPSSYRKKPQIMSDLGYFFIFKFTEIILLSEMPSFDIVQILSFLLLSNFPVDTQR